MANENTQPNRIRELREMHGITQAELARQANVTPSALNKLESGLRGLDQQWMQRLAPLLFCSPADLPPPQDNPSILTAEEMALIERFRAANAEQKRNIARVTEALSPFRADDDTAAA